MEVQDEQYLKKIGRNIAKARMIKNLSQDKLALKADISRRTVFRLEGGGLNPKILTLKKVARALRIKLSEITD